MDSTGREESRGGTEFFSRKTEKFFLRFFVYGIFPLHFKISGFESDLRGILMRIKRKIKLVTLFTQFF